MAEREKEGGRENGADGDKEEGTLLNFRHWQTSTAVHLNPEYVAKSFILRIQFNMHTSCFSIYKMEIIIVIYLLGFLYRLN